uniref:ORF 2 n=1 Tax=Synechococcus elongatus (strain ATCC 33912 / PCC 7942 / FACHB-805) TaxID=1140 RepID=Q54976_SYNE7|nr:ORF 2 [Synechococcus elongatus PCC 7942 = FACHB-805]prf//1909376B rbc downstream ORF 2 [Synechococcus sp.]
MSRRSEGGRVGKAGDCDRLVLQNRDGIQHQICVSGIGNVPDATPQKHLVRMGVMEWTRAYFPIAQRAPTTAASWRDRRSSHRT